MKFKILPMITKPNTYCLYRFNTQEEIEIRLTKKRIVSEKNISQEERNEIIRISKYKER